MRCCRICHHHLCQSDTGSSSTLQPAACCSSRPTLRVTLVSASLLLFGILSGVLINLHAEFFPPIRVHLQLSGPITTPNTLHRLGRPLPSKGFVVPNIVHFVWFSNSAGRKLSFLNYISIRSAHQIQKPDKLLLHCNRLPTGQWWERLWRETNLTIVYRDPPKYIHGQRLYHIYHQGDIAKIEILLKYGGIYLDYDVIVVNSLDGLRRYDATLGKERPPKFIAGIIVARPQSTFLQLLYESYRNNYRPWDWDFNCARVAYQIYLQRPDLLNVEPRRLTTPDWTERHKLWNEVIDWSGLYVIHVMGHFNWEVYTPDSIRTTNSTFGQTMRYIYYGSPELIR